jgi:hypothetical protein
MIIMMVFNTLTSYFHKFSFLFLKYIFNDEIDLKVKYMDR